MNKSKRNRQARTPRVLPQEAAGPSAQAKRPKLWVVSAVVPGIVLLVCGAVYFLNRADRPSKESDRPGPFAIELLDENPNGQTAVRSLQGTSPTNLAAVAPGGRLSNQPASAVAATDLINSNWDAIVAGREKGIAAAELAKRATALLAAGSAKEAVRIFEEAVRLTPEDEDLHYNLAIAYGQSGDTANAERHYREALRLLPDYPEVHNNLGNLLLKSGRQQEAEQEFLKTIELMPEFASAHNNLGIVRQSQNRLPEAIACFRKAVEHDTNYWQAHFNLAVASLAQGAKEECIRELQTVLRINPGYEPARSALGKITGQSATPSP